MEVTPYKFRDGSWGVKVKTTPHEGPVQVGEIVRVVPRTAKPWLTEIASIKWSGNDADGDIALCTTKPVPKSAKPTREDARQESLAIDGDDARAGIAKRFDAEPVRQEIDPDANWIGDDDLPF